ncbi:conserved domain protein [Streptococcus dysgalactiae subsp. equisimilis SK1250]|nr:conserved domain protein [Streptococcus dysgalactiae subsp. equisimilis SK1250]
MIKCNQDLPKNSLVVDMTLEKAAQLYENQVLTDTQRFRKIRLSESGLTLEV